MSSFSTPAIVLRRIDFGDYDLIITFFSSTQGKISAIAKSAKKSTKRFAGVLELFSVLNIVCSTGRKKGLPILQEAALVEPFSNIRSSIIKTAYASYWAELVNEWMESGQPQAWLYRLLEYVLRELDMDRTSESALSILFQMRFLTIAGLVPNLRHCSVCGIEMEKMPNSSVRFNLAKGGIACDRCVSEISGKILFSKGTVKQLLWVERGNLNTAARVRFTSRALKEGLDFLEAFVPYHLGKEPRSLRFLRQIRQ
jgi:DNA repair protein RecO (recombination protein O)